jgi:TRAP-type C4-dicarboxylate transport system permease small subunit
MLKRLAHAESAVAVAILAAITGMIFAAAVMRFFGRPLIWSVDLAQLLFIWLCVLGATRAMREKAHIGVDVLVVHLPHRWRLAVEIAVTLLVLAFLTMLAVEGAKLTWLNRERTYGDSGLSYAFVTVAVPVGCLLLSGSLIGNLVAAWRRRGDGASLVYTRTAANAAAARSEL